MIKHFSDLAANERTYLSWIRSAIALMTFGFLIEKFELFLQVVSAQIDLKTNLKSTASIEAIGVAMMIVSVVIMIGATIRFIIIRKNILSDKEAGGVSGAIGLLLSLFLVLVSLFLVGYIWLRLFY